MEEIRPKDRQAAHTEQQKTIRASDAAKDEYVRHTRPKIVRLAWYTVMFYIIVFEFMEKAFELGDGAQVEIATIPMAIVLGYFGFRTADKRGLNLFEQERH